MIDAPLALLAELTHRCPLQCPYCSNPIELARVADELGTDEWLRLIDEAAALGILQIHFSGGEPLVRRDLPQLVGHARAAGLYSNLITSGVLLDAEKLKVLAEAGLDHVQISIQDTDPANADKISAYPGGLQKKRAAAQAVHRAGLALTINAVVHRQNLDRLDEMIAFAEDVGAERIEIAHVQYYGWALKNRDYLMPTLDQLDAATALVEAERLRLGGRLLIDYVIPDYYARRPKACMGGWGRRFINVSPTGNILPCHAAETIPGLTFANIRGRALADIWANDPAFEAFRGTDWMPQPCQSCERKEIDWGGCRCQALALTGNAAATDPACQLSPAHAELFDLARQAAAGPSVIRAYRRIGGA
jgi:pyrroloquinoline quinone biosynthesis protein E